MNTVTDQPQVFAELNLPEPLLQAIRDLGFATCTPIQSKMLASTLTGRDAMGQAQTGTGKTAAFLITIITALIRKPELRPAKQGCPIALIIAPVRELAMQITRDAEALTAHTDLYTVSAIGGETMDKQYEALDRKPVDLLIGTPGRLLALHRSKKINLRQAKFLVIDEADRMLDMGFIADVSTLVGAMPNKRKRQSMLLSATLDKNVHRLGRAWLNQPEIIEIAPQQIAAQEVDQIVYLVSNSERLPVLCNILRREDASSVLIFTNRRDTAQWLYDRLRAQRFECGLLSGAIRQEKRSKTLSRFRDGQLQSMVATDVAGRGLHIEGLSHVVNYDLPLQAEDYVHRIGRTGRAGKRGCSISLACEDGVFELLPIEELLKQKLKCEVPPEAMFHRQAD